jgi:hypothetical protein
MSRSGAVLWYFVEASVSYHWIRRLIATEAGPFPGIGGHLSGRPVDIAEGKPAR